MKAITAFVLALLLVSAVACAEDEHEEGESRGGHASWAAPAGPGSAKWQQECGSCHLAFAPAFLPAESWRKMMSGLDQHFGADASLTAAESQEISAFLVQNASTRWSAGAAPLRITETEGFKRAHRGDEVPAGAFKRASVKSPANCLACHGGAGKGDFNERAVKIPK
jgi:hypothetical protein